MVNRVFVIADTHFGHKRIIEPNMEKGSRPFNTIEEHDAELVYRWNHTVKKNDTVWHLGDVLFGKDAFDTLAQLNGIKKLILGNHDTMSMELYQKYFTKIYGSLKMRHTLFSHVPVHPCQLKRFPLNVHGHMHAKRVGDPAYVCVSVEQTNLAPVLMDTVLLGSRK